MQTLSQTLKKLNPEQLEGVNTTEWPVMVIAWPWTWKTQILAWRIANILQKNLAEAKNILCLTFTDSGVIAMRKRLFSFIWWEAYKVNIHTFHSFCNEIIQDNLDHFQKRELNLAWELEQAQIVEKIIKNLKVWHILYKKPWSDINYEVKRLSQLFSIMKSEDWKIEEIEKAVDEYVLELPNKEWFTYKRKYKQFQKWDLKPDKINWEKEKMAKLIAWAKLFEQYQKLLKESNSFDYQDMILWVIKAFKSNPEILAKYQEQFLYTLVDEFQDTNGSQKEILDLLNWFWESPNIFVVWDDDQSIFRFQGANLKNILSFYKDYNDVKTVVLKRNYRSSQKVLDLAKSSIEFNLERLVSEIWNLDKNLIAENPEFKNSEIEPKIVEYFNTIHEEAWIVEEIEKLQKSWIDLDKVAVIYKNHAQAENIIKALEQKKIPINVKKAVNILYEPLIHQLIAVFSYLQNEAKKPYSNQDNLFKILNFEFFWISIKNLAILLSWLWILNKDLEQKIKLRDLISSEELLSKISHISDEDKKIILDIWNLLNSWISNISNKTVQEQLELILSESWILKKSLLSSEKSWKMRLLNTFFNFIKEESRKKEHIEVKDLIETISQMINHWIWMPVSKITFAKKWVNFVTAHWSKWLEFKYVFLIWVQNDVWNRKRKSSTFAIPDTLTMSNEWNDTEESRRLFFVAITRAKEFLQISYSAKNTDDKEKMPSQFVNELIQQGSWLKVEKIALSDEVVEDFNFLLFSSFEKEAKIELIDTAEIDDKLENYSLSVSDLNKYLRCPITFYFEKILRVPMWMSASMAFWSAIHYSFECYFKKSKKDEKLWDLWNLLFFFEKWMELNKSSFTKDEFKKFINHWNDCLKWYFEKYFDTFNLNIISEYRISTNIWDIPINWALDKIEISEWWNVRVVDYKTWKYSGVKKYWGFSFPNEKNENWWDYWRQIVFYKILLDNNSRNLWKMEEWVMDFVEKDEKSWDFQKQIIKVDPESEEIVKNQIKDVYKKIKSHQFFIWCNDEKCKWCEFVKNQNS